MNAREAFPGRAIGGALTNTRLRLYAQPLHSLSTNAFALFSVTVSRSSSQTSEVTPV